MPVTLLNRTVRARAPRPAREGQANRSHDEPQRGTRTPTLPVPDTGHRVEGADDHQGPAKGGEGDQANIADRGLAQREPRNRP
jgi:hypothetical protein